MRLVPNFSLFVMLLLGSAVSYAMPYAGSVSGETGAYAYVAPLIQARGSGLPFSFRMDYTSVLPQNRSGHWQHNYAWKVIENPDLSVTVYKSDAVVTRGDFEIMERFNPPVAGSYSTTYMTYSTLSKTATNFVYMTKSLTLYTFDLSGKLLSIVDANGNTQALSYDANGNLVTVGDSRGSTATFSYDAAFHLTTVSYGGFQASFTYDAKGNISSIIDLNGNTTSFTYDATGRLLTVVGSDATTLVQNTYDASSRVISQVDAKGSVTSYSYAIDVNKLTTVTKTDRLGRVSTSIFDVDKYAIAKSSPTGETLYSASYGSQKMVVQDRSVPIVLDMDRFGNPLISTVSGVSTTTAYDAQGHPLTITRATGETATMTYDARGNLLSRSDFQGNVVTFLYDARGNVVSKTDGLGNTTSYIYTVQGDLQSLTDAAGYTATFTYDLLGRLLTVTLPSGSVTSLSYDNLSHILRLTDGLGRSQNYVYDVYGQIRSITDAKSGVTSLVYDANGNVVSVNNRAGKITRLAYDAENNLISITDPLGNITTLTYDVINQLLTTTDPLGFVSKNIWGDPGLLIRSVDSTGIGAFKQYNQGLLISISNSAAGDAKLELDTNGRIAAVLDGLNRKRQLTYNGNDQLTGSIDAANNAVTSSFDVNGQLLSYTDAAGNTTSYTYNARKLRISESDAKGNITHMAYNTDGLLLSRTLASGVTVSYSYDAANRLVSISSPRETISYILDANGNRTKIVSSLTGTISQTLDAMGRLTSRTDVFGSRIAYSYDANGNMITMTYPDGKVVTYAYDKNNRMISVTDWAGRVTGYTYIAGTRRTASKTLPDGSVQTSTYDGAGRLASLSDVDATTAAIYSEHFTRDAVGQITSINESAPVLLALQAASDSRSYDAVNQLVATTAGIFTYDTDGNLVSQALNGVTINMTYDAFGHLMSRGVDSYRYDATGIRIESTIAAVAKRYVQEASEDLTRILMEQDNAGATIAWEVYGHGLLYRVDAVGKPSYYHFNHLGTTMALTNAVGAVTDAYAYDIYGRIQNRTGVSTQPFTYHGQWGVVDDGNNFYYMRARYYDAVLQRFISRDNVFAGSLMFPGTLNRHAFVVGNPISNIDPLGEITYTEGALVAAGAVGTVVVGTAVALAAPVAAVGAVIVVVTVGAASGLAYAGFQNGIAGTNSTFTEYVREAGIGAATGGFGNYVKGLRLFSSTKGMFGEAARMVKNNGYDIYSNTSDYLAIAGSDLVKHLSNKIRAYWNKPEPTVQPPSRCGPGQDFRSNYREDPVYSTNVNGSRSLFYGGFVATNVCVFSGCNQHNRKIQANILHFFYECGQTISSKLSKPKIDQMWRSCAEVANAKNERLTQICLGSAKSNGNSSILKNYNYIRPAL